MLIKPKHTQVVPSFPVVGQFSSTGFVDTSFGVEQLMHDLSDQPPTEPWQ